MRFEVWDFAANSCLRTFAQEGAALAFVAELAGREHGAINRVGLVTVGGPVLTYPLEGAQLLAKAFGLQEDE